MPATVNGIGTTYYGRSNVRSRPGQCERCGREVQLVSHDTRLWFVIFFIPVIPLGKKRVVDYCTACTAHRVLSRSDWERLSRSAMEEAMRKAVAEPANVQAQIELHRACTLLGEWDKADAFQKKLEEEFPRDPRVHLYLSSALAYRGQAAEAERLYRRARELDPQSAPMQPPSPPPRPARAAGSRVRAIVVGVLLLAGAVGAVAWNLHKAGHRTLWVVSGVEGSVTVSIEGRGQVSLRRPGQSSIEIPEGRYRARVSGAAEAVHEFEVESGFFGRFFDDRLFVLNAAASAILVRENTIYAAAASEAKGEGSYQVHYGKPFYAFQDVDYPFQEFPPTLRTKERTVKKSRVFAFTDGTLRAFYSLVNDSRHAEALALAEWALKTRTGERSALLTTYASLAFSHGQQERAWATLKEGCARRPVDIEWHRVYQTFSMTAEKIGELVDEYERLLKDAPGDSALLYLRGRLCRRNSESRPYFERAIQADAKNAWAHNALAYGRATMGDWAGALPKLEEACRLQPGNAHFRRFLRLVRFALQDHEALEKELRQELAKERLSLPLHEELARVLVARGRLDEANSLVDEYRKKLFGAKNPASAPLVRSLRAAVLYAVGDFEGMLGLDAPKKGEATPDRAVALLELGRLDEAEKLPGEADPHLLLALAVGRKGDAAAREKAAAALEKGGLEGAAVAKALRSGSTADLEEALEASLDPREKALALVALAQRHPDRSKEILDLAARLNVELAFPYHFIRRLLSTR